MKFKILSPTEVDSFDIMKGDDDNNMNFTVIGGSNIQSIVDNENCNAINDVGATGVYLYVCGKKECWVSGKHLLLCIMCYAYSLKPNLASRYLLI